MNSRWSRASRRPVDHHVFSLGAARHAGPGDAVGYDRSAPAGPALADL